MGSLQGVRMSSRVETMIRSRPCSSTSIRLWNREGGGGGGGGRTVPFVTFL